MREMTNAMNKHCQDFHVVMPFTAEEATLAAVEQWAGADNRISPVVATQRGRKRNQSGNSQPAKPSRLRSPAKKPEKDVT
ncbi:hypothetical protein ABIA06_003121 [Bradyrhizobium yuanmingense]|uniref:hypothetical protein n=1 Tax=Bradyrhizobium yuanmingense TaxID=108015 RepID=UPI0035190C7C